MGKKIVAMMVCFIIVLISPRYTVMANESEGYISEEELSEILLWLSATDLGDGECVILKNGCEIRCEESIKTIPNSTRNAYSVTK